MALSSPIWERTMKVSRSRSSAALLPRPFASGRGLRHNRAGRLRRELIPVPRSCTQLPLGIVAVAVVMSCIGDEAGRLPIRLTPQSSIDARRTAPNTPVDFFREWSHKRRTAFVSPAFEILQFCSFCFVCGGEGHSRLFTNACAMQRAAGPRDLSR